MSMPQRAFISPDYSPSYKPTDTDDLGKYIRRRSGLTQVWCAECKHWHSLEIETMAYVRISKDGIQETRPDGEAWFRCRSCGVVVDDIIDHNGKRDEVVREYLEHR